MILGRIRNRLLLAFLLLSPVPLAGLAYIYTRAFERALTDTVLANLSAIADKKADQINAYLDYRLADAQVLVKSPSTVEALETFPALIARGGVDSPGYGAEQRRYRRYFLSRFESAGYYDLLLIDTAGTVVFSVRQEPDLLTNLNVSPYRDSPLSVAQREALALLDTATTTAHPYAASGGRPAIFVVAPVMREGKPVGTVALQLDLGKLTEVTGDTTGLGETGETELVQRSAGEALFIAPLRHVPNAAFRYRLPPEKLPAAAKAAFNGGYGAGPGRDYAGVEVAAAWRYLPALRSGMVVKIDAAEAFAPARRLRLYTVGALAALVVVAGLTALAFGRALVTPIQQLMAATRRIAEGDLERRAPVHGLEELRELATSFNRMADRVHEQQATLAQRVAERTAQLRELNETLEQRVDEAVRKNLEQERMLIHQSRQAAMGEMIGNIAHQWRQPLNALNLMLANIKDAYEFNELTPAEMEKYIAQGQRLTQRMSDTIDDFRNFFRPTKEKVAFSLKQSLEDTLDLLGASLKVHNIAVAVEGEGSVMAYGFPNEYSQVLVNLLNNAKDAIVGRKIAQGGIRVRIAHENGSAVMAIRDNGGGIPEEALPRLFDAYFTTKEQGTGIGLYMSKLIIENMGGQLAAGNVEGGAEFTVSCPLAPEAG